jgi:putative transposase
LGTKRHNVVDQNGVPLALVLSGANVHDSKEHDHSWDAIVIPRPDPARIEQHACEDKGYDFPMCRESLAKRHYIVHIPYRGLGRELTKGMRPYPARRWVVERTNRWTNLFRALKIRYCRKPTNYEALAHFANAIICFRMARTWI